MARVNLSAMWRSLLSIAALLPAGPAAVAEDFRIETRIYVGEEKKNVKSVSETTTLFHNGAVYDFITEPAQWAVFGKASGGKPGRFLLLNPAYRVQTELTTEQVSSAVERLRVAAAKESDERWRHAADPHFKETFEPDSGRLILASHFETYTVTTEPAEFAEALPEYREFLDWYAKLNTLLQTGPPPGPRLHLNEALARHRVLPQSIIRTRAGSKEPLRAEHDFTWRLSREDIQRIDEVRAAMASFRAMSIEEFLRVTQPEAPKH
jgi:hypothetical protein